MLPDTQQGRIDYARYRDQRNLHRSLILESNGGDQGDLTAREFAILAMEAEQSGLREQVDSMVSDGMLTPDMVEAAKNCVAWGEALLALIHQGQVDAGVAA